MVPDPFYRYSHLPMGLGKLLALHINPSEEQHKNRQICHQNELQSLQLAFERLHDFAFCRAGRGGLSR